MSWDRGKRRKRARRDRRRELSKQFPALPSPPPRWDGMIGPVINGPAWPGVSALDGDDIETDRDFARAALALRGIGPQIPRR